MVLLLSLAILGPVSLRETTGAERTPLVFLGDKDYPPVAYLEDGMARGSDVDLAKALAAPMKREVAVRLMDWNLAQERMLKGEADGLLGLSISDERRKLYDFAKPTFTREFGLVVRSGGMSIRGLQDLKGKNVGVTPGGFPRRFMEGQSVRLVFINHYPDGLDRLAAGTIDAIAADLWVAAYLIERSGIRGVTILDKPFATAQGAIAVKKGNLALLNEINQAIQRLEADGTISAIQEAWRPQEMLFASRERVRVVASRIAGAFLLIVFGGMGMWVITLKKQIGIRRKAESALRESEARLRTLTDASFEGIGVCEDGILVDANDQLIKMLGYGAPSEMMGKPVVDLVAPESRELVRRMTQSGCGEPYEHLASRKDGSVFPVEVCGRTIFRSPRHLRVTAIRDTTARKEGEAYLKTLTQRLKLATATAAIAVWDWHLRTNEVVGDERLFEIYGLPPDPQGRFSYQQWAASVHPEDLPGQESALKQTIADRGHGAREFRIVRPDGSVRHLQAAEAVITDEHGTPVRMVGVNIDVTGRKESEAALRESEERYRNFIALAAEGIARIDFDPPIAMTLPVAEMVQAIVERGLVAECNDAAARMRGWPSAREMQGRRVTELMKSSDPENRLNLTRFVEEGCKAVDVVTSGRNAQGRGVYFLNNAVGVVQDGCLRHLWTVQRDITERVQAEQALSENQRVLSTLLSNLPGLVYRCRNDVDWTMEFVSEGCRELTGYAPEDLVGNRTISYGQLIHPDDRRQVWEKVQAMLGERKPFELTYRIRTAGGVEKWVWERGQGIFSSDEVLVALEGFNTDVTDWRQAEIDRAQALLREQRAREEYTRQLIASQEADRRRIAGELHDSLGQNLLLVKNRAQLALAMAPSSELRQQIEGIGEVAAQAIAEVRQISHDLRPYQLDQLGLTRALEVMIDSAAQATGIVFGGKLDVVDDVFPMEAATNLYRVVQECLNNILKHSQARHVRIELERDVRQLRLLVEDDGRGFEADGGLKPGGFSGFGLQNIAERIRILGGVLKMESTAGQGTRLEVTIPIPGVE